MENILDQILPEMQKISQAPTLSDLEGKSDNNEALLANLLFQEQQKKYKAMDTAGNVYSCLSPALDKLIIKDGMPYIIKQKPRLIMSAKEAKASVSSFSFQKKSDFDFDFKI